MAVLRPRVASTIAGQRMVRKEITHLKIDKPFRFTDLPRELRDRVYCWLLVNGRKGPIVSADTTSNKYFNSAAMRKQRLDVSIFLASRQLGAESLDVFLTRNTFRIERQLPGDFADYFEPAHFDRIRTLEVRFCTDDCKALRTRYFAGSVLERMVRKSFQGLARAWQHRADIKRFDLQLVTYNAAMPLTAKSPDMRMFDSLRKLRDIESVKISLGDLDAIVQENGPAWAAEKKQVLEEIAGQMMQPSVGGAKRKRVDEMLVEQGQEQDLDLDSDSEQEDEQPPKRIKSMNMNRVTKTKAKKNAIINREIEAFNMQKISK